MTLSNQALAGQGLAALGEVYSQIIQSLPSGVAVVDAGGAVIFANPTAQQILRAEGIQLSAGAKFSNIPHAGPLWALVEEVRTNQKGVSRREVVLEFAPGENREIGASVAPLAGPDQLNGVLILFADITERRNLERAAEVNRQLAQLGELTAGVVHELRNPLTVISGMAELLLRNLESGTKNHRSAHSIYKEAENLEKSIAQFLGFARPFEIQPEACRAEDIATRALQLCERRAALRQVALDCAVARDLPEIQADPARLAQALANIIGNAVDAVAEGKGSVHLRVALDGQDLSCDIEDNGPGIHLGPGEDLFKPFFTKKESGTGLGLAIAHRIITAHGGRVTHRNRLGGGACFEVRVPVQRAGIW